jgi:hypothetical protein
MSSSGDVSNGPNLPKLRPEDISDDSLRLLAADIINDAIKKAKQELVHDPYSFGRNQRFLLNYHTECIEQNPSFLPVWLACLGLDVTFFVEWAETFLDSFAQEIIASGKIVPIKKRSRVGRGKSAQQANSATEYDDDDLDEEIEQIIEETDAKVLTKINLELWVKLPVHHAPPRDKIRVRQSKDPSADQFELLVAA